MHTLALPSFPNPLASYLLPDGRRLLRPTLAAVKKSRNQTRLFAPNALPPHYRNQRHREGAPSLKSRPFSFCCALFHSSPFLWSGTLDGGDGTTERVGGCEGQPPAPHSATSLYCFEQKWQKSFTEQPGLRRRRLWVPEEVVTVGMSDSECRRSVGQTDGRVTEGNDAAKWGLRGGVGWRWVVGSWAECAEPRSRNDQLATGGAVVSLRSWMLGWAVFQSNGWAERHIVSCCLLITLLISKRKTMFFWLNPPSKSSSTSVVQSFPCQVDVMTSDMWWQTGILSTRALFGCEIFII